MAEKSKPNSQTADATHFLDGPIVLFSIPYGDTTEEPYINHEAIHLIPNEYLAALGFKRVER